MNNVTRSRGFSLLEVIVTIVIVSVMYTFARYSYSIYDAKKAQLLYTSLDITKKAILQFKADNVKYPGDYQPTLADEAKYALTPGTGGDGDGYVAMSRAGGNYYVEPVNAIYHLYKFGYLSANMVSLESNSKYSLGGCPASATINPLVSPYCQTLAGVQCSNCYVYGIGSAFSTSTWVDGNGTSFVGRVRNGNAINVIRTGINDMQIGFSLVMHLSNSSSSAVPPPMGPTTAIYARGRVEALNYNGEHVSLFYPADSSFTVNPYNLRSRHALVVGKHLAYNGTSSIRSVPSVRSVLTKYVKFIEGKYDDNNCLPNTPTGQFFSVYRDERTTGVYADFGSFCVSPSTSYGSYFEYQSVTDNSCPGSLANGIPETLSVSDSSGFTATPGTVGNGFGCASTDNKNALFYLVD